jgi:methionine-rich copper-binding protein CopC
VRKVAARSVHLGLIGRYVRSVTSGRWLRPVGILLALLLGLAGVVVAAPAQADVCVTGNAIACENSKTGNPASEWETTGNGDEGLDGYTTDISTNVGSTVSFKIHSEANYALDIYRMGYYGGDGARKITSLTPNQAVSQANVTTACQNSTDTGLIDCGSWGISAQWAIPSTAVAGIYFAHLIRADTGGDSHVVFVVRNDASHSDLIFQTSDTTWQAYNSWGGNSLYTGQPAGRAYKVSYNRPFATRGTPGGRDFVWANEYPMVRFLEAQGYDVSYQSGVDTDRYGSLLTNHKTFLSVGHDEYWSGQQRSNVEAARDAGVNLAFFSANEIFWKTRYESSTVGGTTPYRTLVTYKESTDNAKTDPTSAWTGTWRDPRFSPPADGGRPENALSGTIFTVNSGTRAIKIPDADGKMWIWRGTTAASLAAGQTYTTPTGTLGYEWDEDLDNGARPAGLVRLSSATWDVDEKIMDYSNSVAAASATHHMTLYRAGSGALVFGAGTVQWSWGLDANHDGTETSTDLVMRQATVNLFADMGAQPVTLQFGLNAATKSTDTTAPTSTITSPAAGASLSNGSPITVSGTAADVGGKVGGVEVSVDGGQTWHPATGRTTWSYTGIVSNAGTQTVQARAVDDSANLQATPTSRAVTINCPCSLFSGETPTSASATDQSDLELGVRFKSQVDGWLTGVRFYKGSLNTGTHTGTLWSNTGTKLATGTFTGETAAGWQTLQFQNAVQVTANTTYVASYRAPNGGYASTAGYFSGFDAKQPPLIAARTSDSAPNGVYANGGSFPTQTFKGGNYWVAPLFDLTEPPDVTPPVVSSVEPVAGATSVPLTVKPAITFNEPIKAGTMTLNLSSASGLVPGATSFNAARDVATFTPAAALANGTTYTLTTVGGTDAAGNAVAAVSNTFRTAISSTPGVCPCSVWSDETIPDVVTQNDSAQVELGVKFKADTDGFVAGVRFFKGAQNTGTHVGTLWSSTGTQLATATFTAESSTGWQEVRFSSRVAVVAGQTYVASYHTNTGFYSATSGGLNQAVVNSPLTALGRNDDGGNGMYSYGARQFPTNNSTGANYWVDVVFELPPDVTAPAVTSSSPGSGSTNVQTSAIPTAGFSERVTSGATGSLSIGSTSVPVTVAMDATGRKLTLTPAGALQAGTTYTASVSGAKDAAGNTMTTPYVWSFTTSGPTACPCTLYPSDRVPAVTAANDSSALELGVRFQPSVDGFITGVRFYKGAGNTGTHVGALWTAGGALLTSATFTSESTTGWQQVTFAAPVAVTAGIAYVASYTAPVGHYAADNGQFASAWTNGVLSAPADGSGTANGVYGNPGHFPSSSFQSTGYGVDVVFATGSTTDTVPPSLLSTNPVNGATSVPTTVAPVATFNEALAAASVQASLTGPGSTAVPATVTVGADKTVTVTPSAALAYNTDYTVQVTGSDLAGNALGAPAQWSFRTARAASASCPCSLWPDEATPAVASDSDTRAIEVGVKFSPASAGFISGVRFYKGADNTGTHVGTLWSLDGTELAKATFTGESAAGWQEVTFAQPVSVTAGTTYVASYHADNGGYAATANGFANAAVTRGPLTAPVGTAADPNGVYLFGSRAFPTAGSTTNYWVDVLFDVASAADVTAPTVSTVAPADQATNVAATAAVDALFSESVAAGSVTMTLKASDGTAVPGTVTYDAATRTARFNPTSALGSSTVYTATATGTDLAGNVMVAAKSWSFTTGDSAPPTVGTRSPADGATAVTATSTVSAVFSEPVNPASIQFTLKDGSTAVPGTSSYDAATRKVTFTPTASLPSGRSLTAGLLAADTAGNVMAAPASWQFTVADTVPPVVTAVAATGSGTSATVTWTTNESATSVVTYGTSAASLTSTANGTSGSSHSVNLTGLTANTRYYYRVTSVDPAGNSTTSPATGAAAAQYAPTVSPLSQTSTADFTAGAQSSTYVSDRAGGDVTLAPENTQEFAGTTVPTNWTSTSLATGSSVTVGSGIATVSGRYFRLGTQFGTNRELDAVATLKPVDGQWLGATDDDFVGSGDSWVAFRTTPTGGLVAETHNGIFGMTTTALSSTLIGAAHQYEIDWTGSTTVFKVDGATVASHSRGTIALMRITARDATVDANPVLLDSVWLSPYAGSGVYTSPVIDASAPVDWRNFTPTATIPAGTTVTYQVRTGPNSTPGASWSAFTTVAAGADIPGTARYLQYRATLTTNSTRNTAPVLSSVQLGFAVP